MSVSDNSIPRVKPEFSAPWRGFWLVGGFPGMARDFNISRRNQLYTIELNPGARGNKLNGAKDR